MVVVAIAALSIETTMNAYAQNTTTTTTPQPSQNQTTDSEQIKNYLTRAIQALDTGNNTKAAEQVDLAEDQLEGMKGKESTEEAPGLAEIVSVTDDDPNKS